ncbi:MAG: hypothetical protein ABSE08_13430 [Syntrophobacteraceae bacterium]|jgi:hypothetical protein
MGLNAQSNVFPPGLASGQYNASAPTVADGQTNPMQLDSAGRQIVVQPLVNAPLAGAATATRAVVAGGAFNATIAALSDTQQAALQVDCSGRLLVNTEPTPGANGKLAYRVGNSALTAFTTTYDLFYVQGSATRTVKIKRIMLSFNCATAGAYYFQLQRHAATGTGNNSADTPQPMDSRNVTAATAVVKHQTAASGAPTSPVILGSQRIYVATNNGSVQSVVWEFAGKNSMPLIVSGATDFVSVSMNGQTITSNGTYDFEIEFEEDNS